MEEEQTPNQRNQSDSEGDLKSIKRILGSECFCTLKPDTVKRCTCATRNCQYYLEDYKLAYNPKDWICRGSFYRRSYSSHVASNNWLHLNSLRILLYQKKYNVQCSDVPCKGFTEMRCYFQLSYPKHGCSRLFFEGSMGGGGGRRGPAYFMSVFVVVILFDKMVSLVLHTLSEWWNADNSAPVIQQDQESGNGNFYSDNWLLCF